MMAIDGQMIGQNDSIVGTIYNLLSKSLIHIVRGGRTRQCPWIWQELTSIRDDIRF